MHGVRTFLRTISTRSNKVGVEPCNLGLEPGFGIMFDLTAIVGIGAKMFYRASVAECAEARYRTERRA